NRRIWEEEELEMETADDTPEDSYSEEEDDVQDRKRGRRRQPARAAAQVSDGDAKGESKAEWSERQAGLQHRVPSFSDKDADPAEFCHKCQAYAMGDFGIICDGCFMAYCHGCGPRRGGQRQGVDLSKGWKCPACKVPVVPCLSLI